MSGHIIDNNYNFNGILVRKTIEPVSITELDGIRVMLGAELTNFVKDTGLMCKLNEQAFYIRGLMDTRNSNKEPDNKRLQGTFLKELVANDFDLIGVYKVSNECSQTNYFLAFWENSIVSSFSSLKSNPGAKFKVFDMGTCINENRVVYTSKERSYRFGYPPVLYPIKEFVEYYLSRNA